jgi:hypothetical protein
VSTPDDPLPRHTSGMNGSEHPPPGSEAVTVTVVPDPGGSSISLAEQVAAVVAAHPAVARLHGGI